MNTQPHIPVLLDEVLTYLDCREGGVFIDGTFGAGGYTRAILNANTKNRVIGFDRDPNAMKTALETEGQYPHRFSFIHDCFGNMAAHLDEPVDGIVLDLGVSSYQLDTPERGFSYREDAPLDMRMDQRQEMTARDIVNEYSEAELTRVIRDYGEERFAKNIAKHIVLARKDKVIETTFELNEIIKAAIPIRARSAGGHPSKRTFQAIRIELNRELTILEQSLDQMIDLLNPGGRICIITFHSLEDRIVKRSFRTNENPCTCPPDFPKCVCGKVSKGRVITRKPILPSEQEISENRRSKSAKLRIFERI